MKGRREAALFISGKQRRLSSMHQVLFLCTGNSARSVLAETVLNQIGQNDKGEKRYQAFSAGSNPTGVVNPNAVVILKLLGYDAVSNARSKSWDEFTGPDAPKLDAVITLCDQAAGETCPVWNGAPTQLHWGFRDPAIETDPAAARMAFMDVYEQIHSFLEALMTVPVDELSDATLKKAVDQRS
jgi:arsenate reductase